MNEDYTRPFFVGLKNPRFPYARHGYLPALVLEPEIKQPQEQVIVHRHSRMSKQESDMLQQHDRKLKYLLAIPLEAKTRRKYKTYT